MIARRMNQAELSRVSGMQPPTISKIVKGQRGVTPNTRGPLSQALLVPPAALYEPIGSPIPDAPYHPDSDVQPVMAVAPSQPRRLPMTQQVPVWGVVEGGSDGQFVVNLSGTPLEYVDLPPALVGVPEVGALFVAGMSMAGVWMPGDLVFFAKRRPLTPECYAIALIEAGPGEPPRAFLKQFVKRDNEVTVLRQFNPDMELKISNERIREIWRALHWREWMTPA